MGLPEDFVGQGQRVPADVRRVGQHVERPLRLARHAQAQLPQPRHKHGTPPPIGLPHALRVRRALAKRRYARVLREVRRANVEVLLAALDGVHIGLGRDEPTQPPAGHRIPLRETVQHEGVLGELQHRVLGRAAVGQPVVDLVRHKRPPEPGQPLELLPRHDHSRWVRGRVHHDPPGLRSNGLRHRVTRVAEPVGLFEREEPMGDAQEVQEARVASVVRVRQQHLVPGPTQGRQRQ